jgi:hypothetical protein
MPTAEHRQHCNPRSDSKAASWALVVVVHCLDADMLLPWLAWFKTIDSGAKETKTLQGTEG